MFRKQKRNLRARKADSSGEEEECGPVQKPRRAGGRGLTCKTTKKKGEADMERADTGEPAEINNGACSVLSFSEDRDGEDAAFQIRKPSVTAVIFNVQKKAEQDGGTSADCDPASSSQSEQEHSEPEHSEEEESPGSSSSNTSPSPPSHKGAIAEAKRIRAARRQQNLARTKGDFLSLHVSREASDSSQSESDNELDDHEQRIKFAPGVKTLKEQMTEEMASSRDCGDQEDEDDDDDRQDRWEEQQIRKAVRYPQAIPEHILRGESPPRLKKPVEPKLPPVTMEDIKKKLTTRIASIQEVHRSHLLDNERFTNDLESSKNVLEKLEKSLHEQSFTFFKEMKTYVENFVDCLNEKIKQINELEAEMFEILQNRARTLLKRRQDDLRNQAAALQKLSGNGVTNDVETLDDNIEKQIEDCELRRRKRKQKREESGEENHLEGMSSDDELTTDLENNFHKCRENILLQSNTIFDDVHEDFCRVKNVLCKFHEWRLRFPESYYDAYISLCLHKILSPLVRVQLIGWTPLEDVAELDQMPWYYDLEEFCFSKEEHENNVEENADHKVISTVIEKTVLPRVSELFAECIRRNPEIRGIIAPGPDRQEAKCSLYMDDVTVFCADQRSIDVLVQTCEDFGQASGAKVNCGKSEVMLFGDWRPSTSAPIPFNIRSDFVKILGVWFGADGAALKSWEERLSKMNQKFGLWSLRDLTIEGKSLVLRSEILPVLQYLAQAWPPQATTCKAITRAVFFFIWGSKMDRVKRKVMFKDHLKGGKGVPDIATQLRVFFACNAIRRTLRNNEKSAPAGASMSRFFLLPLWRSLGWDKWHSSVPYNWETPWFYSDCFEFIKEHELHGVKPDLWKPKTIYKLIRANDTAEPVLGLPLDTCKVVWRNVSSKKLTNRHKDLAWTAIQGGLLLRSFMHARNLSKYRHCPFCITEEETALHLFWKCPVAQALLEALEPDLKDFVPQSALSHYGTLYGLFCGAFTQDEIDGAWRVMCCFKDALWCARRRLTSQRERMSIEDCRRLIHSLLRDYDLMDFLEEEEV